MSTITIDRLWGVVDTEVDKWREEHRHATLEGLPGLLKDLLTAPEPQTEALQEVWRRILQEGGRRSRDIVSRGLLLAETDENLRTACSVIEPTSHRLHTLYAAAGPDPLLRADLQKLQQAYVSATWQQKPLTEPLHVLVPGPYLTEAAMLSYMRTTFELPLKLTFSNRTFSAISRELGPSSDYDLVLCTQYNLPEVSHAYEVLTLGTSLDYSLIAPARAQEGVVAVRRHDPRSAGQAAVASLQQRHPLVQNLRLVETPAEQSYEALQSGQHLMAWGALRHAYLLDGTGHSVPDSTYRARVLLLARRGLPHRQTVLPRLRAWYKRAATDLADPHVARRALEGLLENPQFEIAFAHHVGSDFWRFAA